MFTPKSPAPDHFDPTPILQASVSTRDVRRSAHDTPSIGDNNGGGSPGSNNAFGASFEVTIPAQASAPITFRNL